MSSWKKWKRLYDVVNKSFVPPEISQEEVDGLVKGRNYPTNGTVLTKEFEIDEKVARFFGYKK